VQRNTPVAVDHIRINAWLQQQFHDFYILGNVARNITEAMVRTQ